MTGDARQAVVTGHGSAMPGVLDQAGLWADHFAEHSGASRKVAERIWRAAGITTRRGVVDPRTEDVGSWGTGARMARFMTEAMPLGKEAVASALDQASLDPGDVGLFAVVSCTGYGTPGLDIRLAADLGMPPDVQRLHIGHMGCYAALPGLGAVSDYVVARQRPAVLLCVELTSLHAQPPTDDLQQVVAHALFSDAAAAVVVQPGTDGAGPGWEVVDSHAVTDPTTASFMTWDVTDLGFRMGLSPEVPGALSRHVRPAVTVLLERNGLALGDVAHWAVHPGGRRIVEVVGEALDLTTAQLATSFAVLGSCGNCSSSTVLLVLERMTAEADPQPGDWCVAMAFGPGLTLCSTLLRRR